MKSLLSNFFHGWSLAMGIFIILSFLSGCTQQPDGPRKIEILFLGHNQEHHYSEKYLPLLANALTPKGYNFTYTADPADLNPENLSKYDALMIYANHDSISSSQEKALLDYVASGKGFLPIHCASYCFRNSQAYVDLVGAQFKEHKTDTFVANIIVKDHPVTEGLSEFETWDETYVHHMHNQDRTVLMERLEGDQREPWTWVRNYGKGRVFYTAYGHDERTWDNPGFHALIEKGIRWAVGEKLIQGLDQLTFPKQEYKEAILPNYEKRDPPPLYQFPLSPEASQQLVQIPPGFELQLFASEPDIFAPISANWDEKGRLWLLETKDYPNEISEVYGKGNDQIKILEDTDGDGKADKFTVFADNLSIPTSLVFHNGGVIISQAPYFLFLKDTDGDDVADVKEIIMEGWGTFDTHAGPSNLKYGFDNWMWGVVGYSSFSGKVGADSLKFRQGVYRFKPDGSEMEFMGSTTNNTWGLGFSETFDVFISTANNTHSAYMAYNKNYLDGVEALKNHQVVKKIEGHYAYHPVTKNFRQVDVFGGFTAAAGHNLYTARSFPKEYWNRIAFICEPTGHLLHKAVMERDGAGYKEKDDWNMLAGVDEWVSPVFAEVGPDGALWVLDWYNFIIQHNPTPTGFENGRGNAHINPFRDNTHGRIYRLVSKTAKPYRPIQLDINKPKELVEQLKNDNMFWRMHAQRLLVERGSDDVVESVLPIVSDKAVDAIGLNSPAVHALWTLHGLQVINPSNPDVIRVVENALDHPAAGVRKAALQTLPRTDATLNAILSKDLLRDEDANVRMETFLALSQFPDADQVGQILYELTEDKSLVNDPWLKEVFYIAMVKHKNGLISAIKSNQPDLLSGSFDVQTEEEMPINWLDNNLDISTWKDIPVPGDWQASKIKELDRLDGVIWYRINLDLSGDEAAQTASIHLGAIDDGDLTYFNGKKVGGMEGKWNVDRIYNIPKKLLKAGKNVIAIRVEDKSGRGGFIGKPEEVFLQLGPNKKPLAGTWKFKIEQIYLQLRSALEDEITPLELFLNQYGPYAQTLADQQVSASNSEPVDQVIKIKTIKDQMKYDQTSFTVTAGSIVEIHFENNDAMQHNMIIIEPGTLEQLGKASDKLAQSPQGAAQNYVPQLSFILASTTLLNPGDKYILKFKVPAQTGDYPYVCTFPGHWRTMNGIMKVVSKPL